MKVRFGPLSLLGSFRNAFEHEDRMFDELFNRFPSNVFTTYSGYHPPIDLVENDKEIAVYASLPGYKKEDVKINIIDGDLVINGKREELEIPEKAEWLRNERTGGSFRRNVSLPELVDSSKVSASLKDGILEIRIAKKEKVKPKEISVSIQ